MHRRLFGIHIVYISLVYRNADTHTQTHTNLTINVIALSDSNHTQIQSAQGNIFSNQH